MPKFTYRGGRFHRIRWLVLRMQTLSGACMVRRSLFNLLAVWSLFTVAWIALSPPVHAETMSDRREKSTFYVGVSPFGLDYPTNYSIPFSVGTYLGRHWMVGVE